MGGNGFVGQSGVAVAILSSDWFPDIHRQSKLFIR